ncbi:MAG TPA: patatin-like phospholipase RssA [Chromatiales bacterium]|nr:patatin-like phospholipase RssA [Chromatiales bacterium]
MGTPATGEGEGPRVGVALGSGSARGWAHVGVLRALERAGVRPAVVCGSSIGALVGAAYAAGHLGALERWLRGLTWRDVVRFLDVSLAGGGFIEGERLMAFFAEHAELPPIEALPVRYGAVATELESGREVWFTEGPLAEAVRASIALPGLFTPARHGERWLVDGGLVNPVPVSLCRALGAEVVVAVNLNGDIVRRPQARAARARESLDGALLGRLREELAGYLKARVPGRVRELLEARPRGPGLLEVVAGAINIMQDRITRSRMAGDPPEAVILPRLAHIGLMEFHRAREAMAEGREAVRRALPALEEALGVRLNAR